MCWVLIIQGLETYILTPRDPADLDLLTGAIEPHDTPWISAVVGVRGPIAPPDYCNGMMIPIVFFDNIYSFSRNSFIKAIPRPESIPAQEFEAASRQLFDRIMLMTDNAGAMRDGRAACPELPFCTLSSDLLAGGRILCGKFRALGCRDASVSFERRAQHRGLHFLLHSPHHGLY
jgi:hypothetical protein